MKILHVLETSVPHTVGYTVRASAIIENQRKLGIDVVAVTSPLFPAAAPTVTCEEYGGVRYYRTNHIPVPASARTKPGSYVRRAAMLMRYKRAVRAIARKERVDVIHAHSSYSNAYAGLAAARRLRIPLVYEVRTLWGESAVVEDGWAPNSWKYRAIWRLELGAMRRADFVIPISHGIRDALIERGISREKLRVVPNGVDSSRFRPVAKDEERLRSFGLADRFIVGFVGSMRRLEGLSTLIAACAACRRRGEPIGVVIVGDGPDKAHLERTAEELRLSGDVVFTGNVPHTEVHSWYSVMDVVVYPRVRAVINERVTPLKPLEAMAMGKVCIGSDVGGLRELIDDGKNGVIFRSGDSEHLADMILELKHEPARRERLGVAALEYVHREREWIVIVRRYLAIYRQLLKQECQPSMQRT